LIIEGKLWKGNFCFYLQKRTAYDFLPTAGMCSISYCASGTVRGYDEFVPHNIDVVHEERPYRKWSEFEEKEKGMIKARRLLNGWI
jgi:glycogen debranching enzyme